MGGQHLAERVDPGPFQHDRHRAMRHHSGIDVDRIRLPTFRTVKHRAGRSTRWGRARQRRKCRIHRRITRISRDIAFPLSVIAARLA